MMHVCVPKNQFFLFGDMMSFSTPLVNALGKWWENGGLIRVWQFSKNLTCEVQIILAVLEFVQ